MSNFAAHFIFAIVLAVAGFALAPPASAVQLDPGGQGQVLLYPYYTVNNHQQTLLSIINTSDADQVVQVTFREALNGRSALQFKVWLGRKDVWTGTVFALADDGLASDGAGLLTRDRSCTSPLFSTGSLTSGGATYFPLSNLRYSGAHGDGGPGDLGRARHGWIEVIALANVLGAPATAMTFVSPTQRPADCAYLQNLALDQTTSARPGGGLTGASSVIRVVAGTILSSRAEAISGFTEISLYTNDAMQPAPDLASVNEGIIGTAVSAKIVDELGHRQVLTYGTPGSDSRPIDAVSATLMATRVKNEYQTSQALAAATDWVVTMPTKPFYTDPALIGPTNSALPPFDEPFQTPGYSRQCAPYRIFDHNQKTTTQNYLACSLAPQGPFTSPSPQVAAFPQAANVVPFLDVTVPPIASSVLAAPAARTGSGYLSWHIRPIVGPAGWLEMNLAPINFNHRLPASAEGKMLSGLPAVGYSASNIVNGNVSNGVLANYAYAVRHVTSVACTNVADGLPCE